MSDESKNVAELIELVGTLNDRLAKYQVRLALVEHAVATFALSNEPKALATLISSLEIVKMDWREQGSPDPVTDLITVLKKGSNPTGPEGTVHRP